MDYDKQRKIALHLFRGNKYKELREMIKNKKCFHHLLPIAEKAGAIEHWDKFLNEWKFWAGCSWEGITDKIRIKEFPNLEGEWKYRAGRYWEGITDNMRIKVFPNLQDEWKYWAGRDWEGITDNTGIKEQ